MPAKSSKSAALAALDYLARPEKYPPARVCVIYGDETFLKREVLEKLKQQVVGGEQEDLPVTVHDGPELLRREGQGALREVLDELATISMFGGSERMVVVEQADRFVSQYRAELERHVAREKAAGILVLDVTSWPSNTKLYKAVAASGLAVECKQPSPARIKKWLISRAKNPHQAQLDSAAAELLLEMVEPELGLLDQELARLALLCGIGGTSTVQLVQEHVGSWRTQTTWQMIDAAAEGDARGALELLDRLIRSGEEPIAMMGQISYSLRQLAAATRLYLRSERSGRRGSLKGALEQAGVKRFKLGDAEKHLKQIGRDRGRRIYPWLLEADLALKGASSAGMRARLVLEKLIVHLSKQADPRHRQTVQ